MKRDRQIGSGDQSSDDEPTDTPRLVQLPHVQVGIAKVCWGLLIEFRFIMAQHAACIICRQAENGISSAELRFTGSFRVCNAGNTTLKSPAE